MADVKLKSTTQRRRWRSTDKVAPDLPVMPHMSPANVILRTREFRGKHSLAERGMDHANAIRVDAAVADFTAGSVRVLRALGRARRRAGGG